MNEAAENRCPDEAESPDERKELNDLLYKIIQPIVHDEITGVKKDIDKSNDGVQKTVDKKFNKFEEKFSEMFSPLLQENRFCDIISDYPKKDLLCSRIEELKNSIESSISTNNQALQESIQQHYTKLTYRIYWICGGTVVLMLGCFILFYIFFSK